MEKNRANVQMTAWWTVCIAITLIACSLIWANAVISDSNNKVKIVEIQAGGAE